MSITPDSVRIIINVVAVLMILVGALIGLRRGVFKATYRFIFSLVTLTVCWLIFPMIMKVIIKTDISSFMKKIINVENVKTIEGLLLHITGKLLGYEDVSKTVLYSLLFGITEMVFRVVFSLVILILNWTLFRIFSGIIYRLIRKKQRIPNKKGKMVYKKPSGISRLFGCLVGAVNTIWIMFFFFTPIGGVFSIIKSVESILPSEENLEETAYVPDFSDGKIKLGLGDEVVSLNNDDMDILKEAKSYIGVYYDSFPGKLFGIKIKKERIDCLAFDEVFRFKVKTASDGDKSENIKIRKEICTAIEAVETLVKDIIEPLEKIITEKENDNLKAEVIDNLKVDAIGSAFEKLSELKFVKILLPIGVEFVRAYAEKDEIKEMVPVYIDLTEVLKAVEKTDLGELFKQIGKVAQSVLDLASSISEDGKPSILLRKEFADELIDKIFDLPEDKVKNVFDAVAEVEILDNLNDVIIIAAEKIIGEKVNAYLLKKPRIGIKDGLITIGDKETSLAAEGINIDNVRIEMGDDGKWLINGKKTDIDGTENQYKLDFEGINFGKEIKNIGNIYGAFVALNISSIEDLKKYINGEEGSQWDDDEKLYEDLKYLFDCLLCDPGDNYEKSGSKLISRNKQNVYVLLNNFILPNDMRGILNEVEIEGRDLASVVMACKILADSGILAYIANKEKELDYVGVIDEYGDKLIDRLFGCRLLSENMTVVVNALMTKVIPSEKTLFSVPEGYEWGEEGKEDLKKFLKAGAVIYENRDDLTKFLDLEKEKRDEILSKLKEACKTKLIYGNMNNLIEYVNDTDMRFKLSTLNLEDWNEDEIENLFGCLGSVIDIVKETKDDPQELIQKILTMKEEEADSLLNSKFIVMTIVDNLYEIINSEGDDQQLKKFISLDDIERDEWFDVRGENGEIETEGELRKLFASASYLLKNVDFNKPEEIMGKVIENVVKLENAIGEENDEIGKIISCKVLKGMIIKTIENLSDQEGSPIKIQISDETRWEDDGNVPGELRKFFSAIKTVLLDEGDPEDPDDDKCIFLGEDTFNDENLSLLLNNLLNNIDGDCNPFFESHIILDTLKQTFVDLSNPKEDGKKIIYFRNSDDKDREEWKKELKGFIEVAKILLTEKDESGNIKKDEEGRTVYTLKEQGLDLQQTVKLLIDLKEEDVETITENEILVDTIAMYLIEFGQSDNSAERSVISVPLLLKPDNQDEWNDSDLEAWRQEERNMIFGFKALLGNDSESIKDMTSGDLEKIVGLLLKIDDDKTETIVSGGIITKTIAMQLIELAQPAGGEEGKEGQPIVFIPDSLPGKESKDNQWNGSDLEAWRQEERKMISGFKALLGNDASTIKNFDIGNEASPSEFLGLVLGLINDENPENDKLSVVLKSDILTHTIVEQLKATGRNEKEEPTIKIPDDMMAKSSLDEEGVWKAEIRNLIGSTQKVLGVRDPDSGKWQVDMDFGSILNKIMNLKNEFNQPEDEVKDFMKSEILVETIVSEIKKRAIKETGNAEEQKGFLVIDGVDDDKWKDTDEEPGELRKIFKSVKLLLAEYKDGKWELNIKKLEESFDDIDSLLEHIVCKDEDDIDKSLESTVMTDSISYNIKKMGAEENAMIVVSEEVKDFSRDEWKTEIKALIKSTKEILYNEETEKVELSKLNGTDPDALLGLIVNKTDEELDMILNSVIFTDTISENIKKMGAEENAMIVVSEDFSRDEWRAEIKALIKSTKEILYNEETEKVELSKLNGTDPDALLGLIVNKTDEELDMILNSVIFTDTTFKNIESFGEILVISDEVKSYDRSQKRHEITALIKSSRLVIAEQDETGRYTVDVSGISNTDKVNDMLNRIINLTNDYQDPEHDQTGIVLESEIIADTIIGQIEAQSTAKGGILVIAEETRWKDWDEDEQPKEGELRKLFRSINLLFKASDENNDIREMKAEKILDKILSMNEIKINELFESDVIRGTSVQQITTVLTSESLNGFIELGKDYEGNPIESDGKRYEMVDDDLVNIILTLQELNDCGIGYNAFSFAAFRDQYEEKGNKIPDALQRSKLIVHSLPKMMKNILNNSVADETITGAIKTDVGDHWLTKDEDGKQPFEDGFKEDSTQNGELRKVFAVMGSLQNVAGETFDIAETQTLLHNINNSEVLHGIIPCTIDRSLVAVDDWKYGEDERRDLTVEEWDLEIDVLTAVISRLSGGEIGNVKVYDESGVDTGGVGKLIKLIALSRYIDVENFGKLVKEGIESAFGEGTSVKINPVSTYKPNKTEVSYEEKLAAWNGDDTDIEAIENDDSDSETKGEVDELKKAIECLSKIKPETISLLVPIINTEEQRKEAVNNIGAFLDQCMKTTMLQNVPDAIISKINDVTDPYVIEKDPDKTYTEILEEFRVATQIPTL